MHVLFCTFAFHAVSPRPGLVKLPALSNFQARRQSPGDPCFTGQISASFYVFIVDINVIGASFLFLDACSCHKYLDTQ